MLYLFSVISSISLALVSVQPEMLTSTCEREVECRHPTLGGHSADTGVRQETTSSEDIWKPPIKKMKIKDTNEIGHNHDSLVPGEKTVVVTVTDVPELTSSNEYICSPVLTWKSKAADAQTLCNSICCTRVIVSASQISGGNLELGVNTDVMSRRRDLVALEAVCVKTQVWSINMKFSYRDSV